MESTEFWQLVAVADDQARIELLAARSEREILAYQRRFDELDTALYRWNVWAAAYLIGRGCSDDGFSDFRAGVISLGPAWYARIVAAPDELTDHPLVAAVPSGGDRYALFREVFGCTASSAYERRTGDGDAFYEVCETFDQGPAPDMGEEFPFEEAELRHRLPRLAALFLDDLAG